MRITETQLRRIIRERLDGFSAIDEILLEGFKDDQRYLIEKYPDHAADLQELQPKWIDWLIDRFGESPRQEEIHPIEDAIVTIKSFSKRDSSIGEKYHSNEQFKSAIDARFPPDSRRWTSPADAKTMTVDVMENILGLAQRQKQRFEVAKTKSFEGDRIGKVGPWNLWMPSDRENSCSIAGYDPVTLEPKTVWCTARTAGSNLFYNYVGKPGENTTLFYVIRDNPSSDEDWLSVGFINGKPIMKGKNGGISVDRDNRGLTPARLKGILGSDYDKIMATLTKKNKELGGKHPARQKILDATQSVETLKYLITGLSKDESDELKIAVLDEENVAPEVLAVLAKDSSGEVRVGVAYNRSTPAEVLQKLVNDENESVRRAAIGNPSTPADVLRKLASDESHSVRLAISTNMSAPLDVLQKLASDESEKIRASVASRSWTPADVLRKLASDESEYVRQSVAANPAIRMTVDIATKLASDESPYVLMALVTSNNTTLDLKREILAKLAISENAIIFRVPVAMNPSTPIEALKKLAQDEKEAVRRAAENNLAQRKGEMNERRLRLLVRELL